MDSQKPQSVDETISTTNGETIPSRRDFLLQSSRAAAGIGVAAVLGNLGHWALSFGAENEPIKVGVLHSLSGTMAISGSVVEGRRVDGGRRNQREGRSLTDCRSRIRR